MWPDRMRDGAARAVQRKLHHKVRPRVMLTAVPFDGGVERSLVSQMSVPPAQQPVHQLLRTLDATSELLLRHLAFANTEIT